MSSILTSIELDVANVQKAVVTDINKAEKAANVAIGNVVNYETANFSSLANNLSLAASNIGKGLANVGQAVVKADTAAYKDVTGAVSYVTGNIVKGAEVAASDVGSFTAYVGFEANSAWNTAGIDVANAYKDVAGFFGAVASDLGTAAKGIETGLGDVGNALGTGLQDLENVAGGIGGALEGAGQTAEDVGTELGGGLETLAKYTPEIVIALAVIGIIAYAATR